MPNSHQVFKSVFPWLTGQALRAADIFHHIKQKLNILFKYSEKIGTGVFMKK